MIGRLRGVVVEQNAEVVVVDVSGVGYSVRVTASVLHRVLEQQPNNELELVVHTEVRENDISLFGFSSSLEKRVFLLLQRVRGVGARLAIQIVSTIGAEHLLSAIGQGSVASLCTVPGVGKKTAERIIVELREMVTELLSEVAQTAPSLRTQISVTRLAEDALLALEKLGFSFEQARVAVLAASDELGSGSTTEEILHAALTKAAR